MRQQHNDSAQAVPTGPPRRELFCLCALLALSLLACTMLAQMEYAADAGQAEWEEKDPASEGLTLAEFLAGLFAAEEAQTAEMAALPETPAAVEEEPQIIREWYGGKAMERGQLRQTLRRVTETLMPDGRWSTTKVHDLLMETAAVETALGEIVRQKNGPALSVWQILGFNFVEIQEYFSKKDPQLLARAMLFYNAGQPESWNRVHNVPWTAAMSLLFYEKATQGAFLTRLDTLESRGRLWKQIYNTRLGKGTVEAYVQRALEYVHVEARG